MEKQSNSLVFKKQVRAADGNDLYISIRLNDECKNGHQDFAITADLYQAGKPKADRYHMAGGCLHDDIHAATAEFDCFIALHLCDYKGIPTHAVANGYYHLTRGFNSHPPGSLAFAMKYCSYYRLLPHQFNKLSQAESEVHFYLLLLEMRIFEQWEEEAKQAIEILEHLTDTKFIVDSQRTQLHPPSETEIEVEKERLLTGYYSDEKKEERRQQHIQKLIDDMRDDINKKLDKEEEEFKIKKHVLLTAGELAFENCIYYNHSKTLSFNWRGYGDKVPAETIELVRKSELPIEGVTVVDAGK